MEFTAYLRLVNGDKQEAGVTEICCLPDENVTAVYIDGEAESFLDAELGAEINFAPPNAACWTAIYRHTEFWCCPEFGTDFTAVPMETQSLIYRKTDGLYGVILPVVSEEYKCVLAGNSEGGLSARLFSWYGELKSCQGLAFVYAEGENPFALMAQCVKAGLRLLGRGYPSREERRYPEIFEYLGWCSWDALQIKVSEAGVLEKCAEFKEKDIPVRWVLIDDMWAHVREFHDAVYNDRKEMMKLMGSSTLYDFEADPPRFPEGLKSCIKKIKDSGFAVGMWHPTTGYWKGVNPKGPLFQKYGHLLLRTADGWYIPHWEQDKAYMFYAAFHGFLKGCGADFVKIDNQTMIRRFYKGLAPVGQVARAFHDGMEASVGQHFDNRIINCMGMGSEDIWNRAVSPVARCSDDFLPDDKAWFTKHILQCAYNCILQGQFYTCDWDMWWTGDGQAVKNSLLRAISGGPIYISDKIGESRRDVLMPLVLSDGRILRCDRPAMPVEDCLTVDPRVSGRPFKVQNICGDSGAVAVFNLNEKESPVNGAISPSDVDDLEGEEFVCYEHFSRTVHFLRREEQIPLTLMDGDDYRLYIIVPVQDGFAPIGRIDKFISPKTIKAVRDREIELVEAGIYAWVLDGKLHIEEEG